MIHTADSLASLQQQLQAWREAGQDWALVPTMGNLHEGHLRLVDRARELADKVVVSIYVNPAQFGVGEDFDRYPRTLTADLEALQARGCDLVFTPDSQVMYPAGLEQTTRLVAPPGLSDVLCGATRPGHFDGVVTVVARLFNMVRPKVSVFGEKDYQQLLIIRRLVQDLFLDLHIESVATVREADGLAMSSRNRFLAAPERQASASLHRVLEQFAAALRAGESDWQVLEASSLEQLREAGFRPDYCEVRRASDLGRPGAGDLPPGCNAAQALRVFVAARVAETRLIDNIPV